MNSLVRTALFVVLVASPILVQAQEETELSIGISVGATDVASISYELGSQWQISFLTGGANFRGNQSGVYRTALELRYFMSATDLSGYIGISPGVYIGSEGYFVGVVPVGVQAMLTDQIALQLGMEAILASEVLAIAPSVGVRLRL